MTFIHLFIMQHFMDAQSQVPSGTKRGHSLGEKDTKAIGVLFLDTTHIFTAHKVALWPWPSVGTYAMQGGKAYDISRIPSIKVSMGDLIKQP